MLDDQFVLSGAELTLEIAEQIKTRGLQLIGQAQVPIVVDCAGVERANSVTVAVFTAWYRAASLQEKSIVFVNLSEELRNIIAFSGLSLLPVSNQQAA